MKQGKSIVELAKELERIENAKKDFIADTRQLEVQPSLTSEGGMYLHMADQEAMPMTHHALRQVSSRLNIPAKYVDRLAEKHPDILAYNVNELLHREPEKRMVRTLDGNVRAFMSDRYRIMDNYDLASAVLPHLMKEGTLVKSCEITPRKMYIKVIKPDLTAEIPPPPGAKMGEGHTIFVEKVTAAFCLSNSEIGLGGLQVQPGSFTARCTNLATFNDYSMNKYHIGTRQQGDGDMWEIYSDKTKELADKAIWAKVSDIAGRAMDGTIFNMIVQKLSEARGGTQIQNAPKAIELLQKTKQLTDGETGGILSEIIKGGDLSRFGVHMAVTAFSSQVDDYDRASELEKLGGEIIDLKPNEWKTIAEAA